MSVDTESHDDVAGLFKRLGRRDDTRRYHDFSSVPPAPGQDDLPVAVTLPAEVALAPATDATLPPAIPQVMPQEAANVVTAERVETAGVVAAPAPAGSGLAAMFQRLAEVPLSSAAQSPLSKLRQR